ncbi:competence/damage-inducible protein A [Granulicella aggregans]|jgi:nicotinamide-nucleotide amidase|uniref:competence/damage-inducible protein A n=1 Tax=Granulicella aggregans TaxID=474949 RepID=UPI0021DF6840|nr:competence/damage-inducible protein A [Granulicella aggregans]
MIAEIIAAGSEMLTPFRQDTNSLYLTSELNDLGVAVAFKTIVGDNLQHLTAAASVALMRANIVIFSGGLGPTEDDLTREAVAAALDISLVRDEKLLADLAERFAKRGFVMTANNSKQADVLEGAEILPNINGSAVGQFLVTNVTDPLGESHRRIVILLPGPPRELKPLFAAEVKHRLIFLVPERHIAKRVLRMALLPESQVDARTAPIYKQFPDVETTILAHAGEIQLHFQASAKTVSEAQSQVDNLATLIKLEMGEAIFSDDNSSLEEVALDLLAAKNYTLATAESCTGGLLAQRITAIPGSSKQFLGGAVVYSNDLKTAFADVPADIIAAHGAVSEPVARALAQGIRKRTNASVGIGITGIAGPGGGDANKPVGLVYISLATPTATTVTQLNLMGDRDRIRWWSSQHALELLRQALL